MRDKTGFETRADLSSWKDLKASACNGPFSSEWNVQHSNVD